jgi:hypothetical protein
VQLPNDEVELPNPSAYHPSRTPFSPLLAGVNNLAQSLFAWLALVAVISVIVRYRRAAGTQRQQIKRFAFGATLLVVFILGGMALAQAVTPSGRDSSNSCIANMGFVLGFVMLPLGAGGGVLRYRLSDIDLIINRTLVFGSLSLVLAAVYFGGVVGAQAIEQTLTGQMRPNPLVIVLSTLLIAALFSAQVRHHQEASQLQRYPAQPSGSERTSRTSAGRHAGDDAARAGVAAAQHAWHRSGAV